MRSQSSDDPKTETTPETPPPEAQKPAASLEDRVAALEKMMERVKALTGE